jgi:HSP20 family protein
MADAMGKGSNQMQPRSTSPATRREGGHSLQTFRDEMDRLFDSFFSGSPWGSRGLSLASGEPWSSFGSMLETRFPAVDVAESEAAYKITAELPGMEEKEVEVTLAGNTLSIRGEKKDDREEKKEDYYLSERRYGSFQRSFTLPSDADPEKVDATFKAGVLSITIPKRDDARSSRKTIEIKPS